MENKYFDLWHMLWVSGPFVKLILFILIFASILSWAIVVKKKKMLKSIMLANENFLKVYNESPTLKEVVNVSKDMPFSPYKTLFLQGHEELLKIKSSFGNEKNLEDMKKHFQVFGLVSIERSLKKGATLVNREIEQHLSILASIGSVTPFVGLLGTVWGIVNSFTGLSGGGATLDAVAPGIAEALVATAFGLFAAIPAVWFYNYYVTKNSQINADMENFCQDFLNMVERSLITKTPEQGASDGISAK